MPPFARKYQAFLKLPDVAAMVTVALFARMPIGMIGLSMLMFLRHELGSYALAGSAVGAYFISMAATAPVLGRLIDRYGPRVPLLVTGLVQPLTLLALLAAALLRFPYPVLLACAALSGAFQSPITVLTRTLWRHRFPRDEDRRMAFSIDSVLVEINFTLGPALIAMIVALFGAVAALSTATAAALAAFVLFQHSPALKYWKHEPLAERHMLGPLTDLRLVLLFCVSFGLTFCFGLLEVGYPAFATSIGLPALGGLLLAVNSAGSATGGAIYGGLTLRLPLERQFACALALLSGPFFLHAFVPQPVLFAAVAFVAGLAIAPALTANTLMVTRLVPSKYATEAFTWSSTFIVSGLGAGVAVGGAVIEAVSVQSTFLLAGITAAAMAVVALVLPLNTAHATAGAGED